MRMLRQGGRGGRRTALVVSLNGQGHAISRQRAATVKQSAELAAALSRATLYLHGARLELAIAASPPALATSAAAAPAVHQQLEHLARSSAAGDCDDSHPALPEVCASQHPIMCSCACSRCSCVVV